MPTSKKQIIAMSAPVTITAAMDEDEKKGPAKFTATFYTGGPMNIEGWDLPVVVDLAGLDHGNVLVANLDHDRTKRVGNFAVANDGKSLVANGTATAKTPARDEVVGSAAEGYQWQASLEVNPKQVEALKAGKTAEVNGQTIEGPAYITRKGTLKGFAFVSHGADDNTTVAIAASAASTKEKIMKAEVKAWIQATLPSVDIDSLSPEEIANLEADFDGREGKRTKPAIKADDPFSARKSEAKRRRELREIADKYIEARDSDEEEIIAIEKMHDHAVKAKMSVQDFKLELYESSIPEARPIIHRTRETGVTNKVVEAAIAQVGKLPDLEKQYDEQTLQMAHDKFKGRIGLKQLFLLCAQANGYHDSSMDVTLDVQRAAFGMNGHRQIRASGFSTLDIATILSNTANKFIMRGWNMVDQTALRIAKIQNVRDFKTATTVSLTDNLIYEQVAASGEIKHGTLGELTYTAKADTYARMLAITRQDIINDDTGALTDVPMKLGNGAIKLLNHIFWTRFLALVGENFFSSGNSNINTGAADMTEGGLDATYVIFKNQTNPDGTPLGVEPRILLVPTALEGKARRLVRSEQFVTGSDSGLQGSTNIWAGRFTVESSPYISNSSYTGNTAQAWWMLAGPNELPVIAIAALNGRVEPTVETADADFNVLGVQMRGYSDVGVKEQEYRGGVHADGNAS